jgi:hypothetical protein
MTYTSQDASNHLLWHDQQIFSLRHEKSAAYLAAIHEVVAEERFGGRAGEDFLRSYDRLAAADPQEFTAVWSDPAA